MKTIRTFYCLHFRLLLVVLNWLTM